MANNAAWDKEAIGRAGIKLASHAEEMFRILECAQTVVNETESSFNSDEGRKTRERFELLSTEFSKFRDDVQAFSQYITDFSGALNQVGAQIGNAANQLPAGNR